jgi:excisionase family DNA binding protein
MLTIAQAADRLGISPAAVRALVRAGKLRHYRPTLGGRRVVIAEADVMAHLEASQRQDPVIPSTPKRLPARRYRCEIL